MNSPYQPRLSIVILNYNRLEETRRTVMHLQSLLANREDVEVIAVDNGSSDGTGGYLGTQAHWLTVVDLQENKGIAGLNQGFKQARGDYVMVLDDDSHPHDEAALDLAIACLDSQPEVGVVACRIESPDGQAARTWHLPDTDQAGFSMAFVACGFAIRRKLFEEVGWFPGRFFLYQNEIEVAIRVMRQGYKVYYEPRCRVVHRESSVGRSGWRRVYFPTRNTIWIIRRYFPLREAAYLIGSRLCLGLIRAVQFSELGWYVKAVRDGLSEPVETEVLPEPLRRQLHTFWQENSLWHHLIKHASWQRLKS